MQVNRMVMTDLTMRRHWPIRRARTVDKVNQCWVLRHPASPHNDYPTAYFLELVSEALLRNTEISFEHGE